MKKENLLGAILGCVCDNVCIKSGHVMYTYSGESGLIWVEDSISIKEIKDRFDEWSEKINHEFELLIKKEEHDD